MTASLNLDPWKTAWEKWNMQGIVVLSLSLQAFLILFAPLRKRSANKLLIVSVWSAYLLAFWVVGFAVAYISNRLSYDKLATDGKRAVDPNNYLIAFWATCIFVQLGGPDTITAFSLQDNALWQRYLLNIIFQVSATFYLFYQTMQGNVLWRQTVLMMIAGLIKNLERIRAMYLANLKNFKKSMLEAPDLGPNYAKFMDDEIKEGELDEMDVVKYGYNFFEAFKGLIVDIIFTVQECRKSREFFQKRTAADALKVISVELNFIYEVLYTKVLVVRSTSGCISRLLASSIVIATLVMFTRMKKYHQYDLSELMLTYALLYGAIGMDVIALLMLLFSDWSVAYAIRKTSNPKKTLIISAFLAKYVSIVTSQNKPGFTTCHIECTVKSEETRGDRILNKPRNKKNQNLKKLKNIEGKPAETDNDNSQVEFEAFDTTIWCRRWSESIYACNLLSACLKRRPRKILKVVIRKVTDSGYIAHACSKAWHTFFGSAAKKSEFLDSMNYYVSQNPFFTKLWDFIYDELQVKSVLAEDTKIAKQIYEAKGEWALKDGEWSGSIDEIMEYVKGEYDRILLLWHIATELCYNTEKTPKTQSCENTKNYDKEFSKILSDYMLYLLIMQPTMMSNIADIGQKRFRDTCAEAKKFFNRKGIAENDTLEDACRKILEVDTSAKPLDVKGDRSKSVLFDGCRLAKELQKRDDKWKMMSRVWAELLSYAAGHCRAETHAEVLSKGGELITFVWLLMAHLGIVEQF